MSTTLLSNNLFAYNSTHQIIICLSCQYAIQKSALPSHLLRHKIYRHEKTRLLNSISLLSLLEPDLVPLPLPKSKPVDGLSVIDGWCCVKEGCGNLCASEKRMRWHWSEVHGTKDLHLEEGEWKRKCRMQTFFRGTKIRYFEVTSEVVEKQGERVREVAGENDTEMLDEPEFASEPPNLHSTTSSIQPPRILDLETLTYFHHFTTSTSCTLPAISATPENNWQTTIIPLALKHQNLMFGILAISAYHSAFLTTNSILAKTAHLSKAKEFSTTFTNTTKDKTKIENREVEKQIQLILYLSSSSLTLSPEKDKLNIYTLLSIFRTTNTTLSSHTDSQPTNIPTPTNTPSNPILIPILKTLNALPHTLATAFPSPSNSQAEDIFSILHAIRDVITCVSISYGPLSSTIDTDMNESEKRNAGGNPWNGMKRWCELLSARFIELIGRDDGEDSCAREGGAAEVVVYFWATFLLKRAEQNIEEGGGGYWFLNGLAERLKREILEGLSVRVRELVEELHL